MVAKTFNATVSRIAIHRLPLYLMLALVLATSLPAEDRPAAAKVLPFGQPGKFKMLYDARQRPQTVLLNGRVYIVYNGDAVASENGKGSACPMLISYDPVNRTFTKPERMGPRSWDHHFSPIIWADEEGHLHVLHGCHKTPGVHLISKRPADREANQMMWQPAPQIAPGLSYPTAFRISVDRELVYYRTDGHTSSWTYRISADNGRTWSGPEQDVTDLDSKGRLDWSSYQTKIVSRDGRFLHVVFTDYDDNKHSPHPKRFYNPRYKTEVSNEWKYNLSYVKIDLQTHDVFNSGGEKLRTPIDIDYAKEKCQIWDTQWRGAGVPPAVALDKNGEPTFLHVLSGDNLKSHRYYYVRRETGRWLKTPVCFSTHQWNSGHLQHHDDGTIHAFVSTGDSYLEGGYMDRHGGGRIEEWTSADAGKSWRMQRVLSPAQEKYRNWRFNNVQPVVHTDGTEVKGMLIFYGWRDAESPEAQAFLFHE